MFFLCSFTFHVDVFSMFFISPNLLCVSRIHMELFWCEISSRCACFESYRQEAFEADYNNRNAESKSGSVGSGSSASTHGVPCPSCSPDAVFGVRWWPLGNVLVRVLSHLHMHWFPRKYNTYPALGPIPLSAQGGCCGEGEVGGENVKHFPARSAVQCSAAQCSTARHGTARHGTASARQRTRAASSEHRTELSTAATKQGRAER